jgi:hypothetical protein
MYEIRLKFVNDNGNLSSKTYHYNYKGTFVTSWKDYYFTITTTAGDTYRGSKVVIVDIINTDYNDFSLKEIQTLTPAGGISKAHATELGRPFWGDAIFSPKELTCNCAASSIVNTCTESALTIPKFNLDVAATYDWSTAITRLNDSFKDLKESVDKSVWRYAEAPIMTNSNDNKENKTMFENIKSKFDFGPADTRYVKMSVYGLAFKNSEEAWFSFDDEGNATDVTGLTFDLPFLYKMPTAIKDISVGDYIYHRGEWVRVMDENDRGNLVCLSPWRAEEAVVIPAKSPFGFDYVTKLVCFGEDMFKGKDASSESPFGSALPFLLMSDSKDKNSMLLPMLMMQGGKLDLSNPMMLMMLMSKDSKSNSRDDMFMAMLMAEGMKKSKPKIEDAE